jgi:hypothetical protein
LQSLLGICVEDSALGAGDGEWPGQDRAVKALSLWMALMCKSLEPAQWMLEVEFAVMFLGSVCPQNKTMKRKHKGFYFMFWKFSYNSTIPNLWNDAFRIIRVFYWENSVAWKRWELRKSNITEKPLYTILTILYMLL